MPRKVVRRKEAAITGKDVPASVPASVSVSVTMTVLKTELAAIFNKKPELIDPTTKEKRITSEFLVMPTDSPKGGMTITEVIDGVNKLISDFSDNAGKEHVDSNTIKANLDSISSGGVLSKLNVELRQIFIYRTVTDVYNLKDGSTDEYKDTPTKTEKSFEYAVSFVITSNITTSEVFNIKSVALSIWNTKRAVILDRMQLRDVNDLLNPKMT